MEVKEWRRIFFTLILLGQLGDFNLSYKKKKKKKRKKKKNESKINWLR